MWIASAFGVVFVAFLLISAAAGGGLVWAAHRGSWRRAAEVTVAAVAASAMAWMVVEARVPFARAYLASTAAWLLAAVAAPGGLGALQARLRPVGVPVRSLPSALAAGGALWLPLALVGAFWAGCSLDAECF